MCKPGETWFDWKNFETKRCDEQLQSHEILPWQKKNETCVWIKFPEQTETNGNTVCRSAQMGPCRGIARINKLSPPSSYLSSEYSCSENLYFKKYEEICSPSIFEGFPDQCSQIETKVSCCS